MNYDYEVTPFSKMLLAGVFTGIIATVTNLVYDFFYRDISKFSPSEFINVSSLIFVTMLLFTICGLFYFFLQRLLKRGNIVYMIVSGILTLFCGYLSLHVNRSNNPLEIEQFRGLLIGTVAITGGMATLLIPYFVKHDSMFV